APDRFGFILGDGSEATFRTADVIHYYRRLKQSFERFQASWDTDTLRRSASTAPGRWSEAALQMLTPTSMISR
ncbi:MAG: hypothetical protein IPN47_27970, partial [Gemmatimonadetes bacterium]|nr:hypothetical protein [Gemmatimonadota bacterium]